MIIVTIVIRNMTLVSDSEMMTIKTLIHTITMSLFWQLKITGDGVTSVKGCSLLGTILWENAP